MEKFYETYIKRDTLNIKIKIKGKKFKDIKIKILFNKRAFSS